MLQFSDRNCFCDPRVRHKQPPASTLVVFELHIFQVSFVLRFFPRLVGRMSVRGTREDLGT